MSISLSWSSSSYSLSIWPSGSGCAAAYFQPWLENYDFFYDVNWKSNWFVCRMNKDVINLCYYFSCKIFALDHWPVEISTHWSNLASAILIWLVQFWSNHWTSQNGEIREKKRFPHCNHVTTCVFLKPLFSESCWK
jgi:hypothetical protein